MTPVSGEQFSHDYQMFVLQKVAIVHTVNYSETEHKKFSLDPVEKKEKKEKSKNKKEDSPWQPKSSSSESELD